MSDTSEAFLQAGGAMAGIYRAADWSSASIGPPSGWPPSLQNSLGIALSLPVPAALFWQDGELCFYNDAFRRELAGSVPQLTAPGIRASVAFPEFWRQLERIMGDVPGREQEARETGATRHIEVNGQRWAVSTTAISDGNRPAAGIFATFSAAGRSGAPPMAWPRNSGITDSEEKLRDIIMAAPAGIGLFIGRDLVIESPNQTFIDIVGKGDRVEGLPLREAMPELLTEGQPFLKILDDVFTTGVPFVSPASLVKIVQNGQLKDNYYNISYTPLRNAAGEIYGILDIAIDVTEQVHAQQALDEKSRELEQAMEIGQLGSFMVDLKTGAATYAPRVADWFGLDRQGAPLADIFTRIHPEDQAAAVAAIERSIAGDNGGFHDITYRINPAGDGLTRYLRSSGQVLCRDGVPVAIAGIIQDTTATILSHQAHEESEARMKAVLSTAPVAIAILAGPDHIIQLPNQAFKDVVSKGDDIAGRPLGEVLPELAGEGQPFLGVLKTVYETGEPFRAQASPARIMRDGELATDYFNITFSPLYDANGQIYGILDISVNVTDTVLALQRVEANEQTLASAIELAKLGTWSMDVATGEMSYSARLQEWLGIRSAIVSQSGPPRVHERDQERIAAAMRAALEPDGTGKYDEIYTVTHAETGQLRVIHAIGQTTVDENGRITRLSGTAQDITLQRDQQAALEHQVQIRTEELAAAVEELRATNEELGVTNEELHRSNDELAQYAYVASHDLQEPLRKIRVFSGMLAANPELPESVALTIEKISGSAVRMSQLIQDLLAFSRLLKSDSLMRPVSLAEVAAAVWSDFDLIAEEKGAEMLIGPLPQIQAVKLQMNQLFYNLVSNALKFTAPGRPPRLVVASRELPADELKRFISKPLPFTVYHDITVSDNGIGFETQYNEQIFEVFKRLHTREMYPGSGIGLALCRRIAVNHGGLLFAVSEAGKGSTFHIILPERQWDEVSRYEGRAIDFPAGD